MFKESLTLADEYKTVCIESAEVSQALFSYVYSNEFDSDISMMDEVTARVVAIESEGISDELLIELIMSELGFDASAAAAFVVMVHDKVYGSFGNRSILQLVDDEHPFHSRFRVLIQFQDTYRGTFYDEAEAAEFILENDFDEVIPDMLYGSIDFKHLWNSTLRHSYSEIDGHYFLNM